jgi:hypothetical protein
MTERYDWNAAESVASGLLGPRLTPLMPLLGHLQDLYESTIEAISEHPRPGPPAKVGFLLIARLETEIRVCSLLGNLGYGLQAQVIASTIVEIVGAVSYIGQDQARAEAWARHADKRHAYPERVSDGINAALDALGVSQSVHRDSWHKAYSFMCMAKHVNPILSLNYGIRDLPEGESYIRGPDTTDVGLSLSAEALYNSIFFGAAGIVVGCTYCSSEALYEQLHAEAVSTLGQLFELEPWFDKLAGRVRSSIRRPMS